jgi:hypothetical protein
LRGFLVDLYHPGRIPRFPSDPFERKARHIFCLLPHQISTEESTGAHFPDLDVRHFWRIHLGFQSEHQGIFRETVLTHFPVDQDSHFETHLVRFPMLPKRGSEAGAGAGSGSVGAHFSKNGRERSVSGAFIFYIYFIYIYIYKYIYIQKKTCRMPN